MRVLVAPDKFKGTLSALEAALAIQQGWREARPDDTVEVLPMADGGEGTLEALVDSVGGKTRQVRATGPLGDPVQALIGLTERQGNKIAVVESARASGLGLISPKRRDAKSATSAGTGDLIRAALDDSPQMLLVCIGGSAMNDGGTGMAAELGVAFLDARGKPLRRGGAALLELDRIDMTGLDPRLAGVKVIGATDVDNPLTGPAGASAVFGPQKGASSEDVHLLDRALAHLAAVATRDLGASFDSEPGAGAAGGLGFGLMAFVGAQLRPGIEVVMEAVGFERKLAEADLVVTGEGSLDEQSLRGKVPDGVMRVARLADVPVAIICGRSEIDLPGTPVFSMTEMFGAGRALRDSRQCAVDTARALASGVGDLR